MTRNYGSAQRAGIVPILGTQFYGPRTMGEGPNQSECPNRLLLLLQTEAGATSTCNRMLAHAQMRDEIPESLGKVNFLIRSRE